MDKFFNPKAVAIIGASENPKNLALNILHNFRTFRFRGDVYPIGASEGEVLGMRMYKSVLDVPDKIDLAVILTPADTIPPIMEECGKKGIKNVIIESAGFREFGDRGKRREKDLLAAARKYNIRFIGPNCIGTMNLNNGLLLPFLKLNDIYINGRVSIVSQSGGVAYTLLNHLSSENIGIAKIASIGNKLDVDENDLVEYLMDDTETDFIVVYLEGIGDGKRLMEIGRNAKKPILLYKANTGNLSKSLAASHTAALSSDDSVVTAALKQSGIARFRDRITLVNYLKILPLQHMLGNNLAIISRSGGHAILAADAAEEHGFGLAPFSREFLRHVEEHLRANVIKLTNPLDLGDVFDYDVYLKIIEETIKEKNVHGIVFLHAFFSSAENEPSKALIEKTNELSKRYKKPVCVCITTDEMEIHKLIKSLNEPVFTSPLEVVRALALSRDLFNNRPQRNPILPIIKANKKSVKDIIKKCPKKGPLLNDAIRILEAYKIPVVKGIFIKKAQDAAAAAKKIGFPLAVKIVSQKYSHKTDVGGVALNISDEKDLLKAIGKFPKDVNGLLIQQMAKNGIELIIGAKRGQNFGPVIIAGLGGIFVEIFKDVSRRISPFSYSEAKKMLKELKSYPIISGARGKERYDENAVIDVIMKLSQLMTDFENIQEIDINPLRVYKKGATALDCRIIFR